LLLSACVRKVVGAARMWIVTRIFCVPVNSFIAPTSATATLPATVLTMATATPKLHCAPAALAPTNLSYTLRSVSCVEYCRFCTRRGHSKNTSRLEGGGGQIIHVGCAKCDRGKGEVQKQVMSRFVKKFIGQDNVYRL